MTSLITSALDGKRIAVTGATGFLGTAFVERLLRSVPGCEVAVVVRSGKRTPAAERVKREILRNDCFARLRKELGSEFEATVARRLMVIEGDVSRDGLGLTPEGQAVLRDCHTVVH